VIIGKLIPAGTGFVPGRFTEEELLGLQEGEAADTSLVTEIMPDDDRLAMEPPLAGD